MTVEFVLDHIPRRMRELGYGNDYLTRWRSFFIHGEEDLRVDAENEHFFLIRPEYPIRVKSKFGIYDVSDTGINEMQYEHRGKIDIHNYSADVVMVVFIQVIPTHKK